MPGVEFKLTGNSRLQKKLAELSDRTSKLIAKQNRTSAFRIERDAKRTAAVNRGDMRSGITTKFYNDGLTAEVVATKKYSGYVEKGTRPHFPPSEALIPWVKEKLKVQESKARGVAFLVARKISRVGTKPQPFMEPAYKNNARKHYRRVIEILRDDAQRIGSQ